jgi:hypothetical protein
MEFHIVSKKRLREFMVFQKWNLMGSCSFFRRMAGQQMPTARLEERYMSIGTIILIILVIALLGGFSGIGGGPFYGTGYYGGGGLGLVVVILLILLLLGRL